MSLLARSLGFSLAAFVAAGSVASAQGPACTHDTLAVEGGAIAATFCVADASAGRATVTETFARGEASFSRSLGIDLVPGAAVTRAGDDVPLDRFGSNKRLHLTLAYRSGQATLEHALLLPGAVILK